MGRFNLFQLTALSLLSVSVLTGCNEPETPQTEVQLSTDTVDVPAEGGTMNVGYTVSNPAEGAYWSVPSESELEWISDFDFSEEGVIKFNVDTNDSATQREEEVVLEYSSIPGQTFSFLVRQQGNSDTEPFTVEMTQINYVDATAKITPADPEMTYLAMAYTKEYFETLGNDDNITAIIINELSFIAGMTGVSIEEFLKSYLVRGEDEFYFDMLYTSTEHCIYVVGLSYDAERISDGIVEFFTTKSVDMLDVTFTLDVEVNGPDVTITTTPSDDNVRYWSSVILKSEFDPNIQNRMNYEVWKGSVAGKTKEEVLNRITDKGVSVKDTTLQKNTEYVAFVAAVNDECIVNSEAVTMEFTTGDIAYTGLSFDLSVTEITPSTAIVDIVPSNNEEPYSYAVIETSDYSGLTDEEILNSYLDENAFYAWASNRVGVLNYKVEMLIPETEYYLIAFGYEQEIVTGSLFKHVFTTSSVTEDFESLEVAVSITESTHNSVTANFTPSTDNILYFNGTCPAGASEESIRSDIEATVNRWVEGNYSGVTCPLDFYRMFGFRGQKEYKYTGLGEYSEYQVFAVAVSEALDTEGQLASVMFFSDKVTLPEKPQGAASLSHGVNEQLIIFPVTENASIQKNNLSKDLEPMTSHSSRKTLKMPEIRIGKPTTK